MKQSEFLIPRRSFAAGTATLAASQYLESSLAAESAPKRLAIAEWKVWPQPAVELIGAVAEPSTDGWLTVRGKPGTEAASLKIRPEGGRWNLEAFAEVRVMIRNAGKELVRVLLRLDDGEPRTAPADRFRRAEFVAVIPPDGQPMTLIVALNDRRVNALADRFPSMLLPPPEFVRHGRVDGAKLRSIEILLPERQSNPAIQVSSVVAQGLPAPYRDWPAAKVFPFVDEYGQYIHRTWETKIQGSRDFPKRLREEDRDLASHQRPTSWNRYGGWEKGPRREASGFFRTEKIDGRWWFVDPEGRLFWSHGVVRVGTRIRVGGVYHGTPLLDRENFFRLPAKDSPLGAFYGTQPQSTRGYYLGKHDHAVYDFLEANLFRKYGANWREAYAARAQRRLANWGLNSIANSSDPVIYLKRQTPYTAIVYSAPLGGNEHRIEASGGAWGRLPDPFDPGWRALMDRTLQTELKESLGDPWCLGFFVDNELHWGEPHHLAEVVLASPARQPAKQAFLAELKTKYSGIAELSRSWSKNYASWDELLSRTDLPDRKLAPVRADLEAFSARVADTYFRGCRDAIKKASPRHMYLGCRFAGSNPMILRTASQYCDIVSMNRYAHVVQDLALPPDVDRPIVIGEFHFGAMDAPSFATANGPGWCANQNDRERAYRVYVESALRNPAIIGTHWFQFYDQPMSGRFDGENFNAGLLDICDTPYPEIVNACRRVAAKLYEYRSGMLA